MLDRACTVELDTQRLPPLTTVRTRNLGAAVLYAAVQDYTGSDPQAHESAAQFLYPGTDEDREHLAWAVRMTDGVSMAWLREMLDKNKPTWDAGRRVQ